LLSPSKTLTSTPPFSKECWFRVHLNVQHDHKLCMLPLLRSRDKCQRDEPIKENCTVFKSWFKRAVYKEPKNSYFWDHIWASLLFLDLPKQLSNTRNLDFGTTGSRVGNKLFFLIFGLFSLVSTVIQLLFPLTFAALLIVAPVCY